MPSFSDMVEAARPNVREVSATEAKEMVDGDPDALIWLRVRDLAHLQATIDELRSSQRVTGTKTLIALDSWFGEPSTR